MTDFKQTSHADQTGSESRDEHIYIGDDARPMSHKLFEALEEATEIDLKGGLSVGYVIDLDAIDSLYAAYDEDSRGHPPVLTFCYQGYEVRIENHQEIRIFSTDQPVDSS